jgi:hypothetical protein
MILYLAAAAGGTDHEAMIESGNEYILTSYHYFNEGSTLEKFRLLRNNRTIFMDSGAYSAHTLGKQIDIDKYIEFCKKEKPDYVCALDSITDPEESFTNWEYMMNKGMDTIPVFHQGESFKHLDSYLNEVQVNYIALGGLVGGHPETLIEWLKIVWVKILDKRPDLRVHGFGITSPNVIMRFPFYSVDSSSWTQSVRFARVGVFHIKAMKMVNLSLAEFCLQKGYEWGEDITEEGETFQEMDRSLRSTNPLRKIILRDGIEEYQKMIREITRYQRNRDIRGELQSQQTLF